MTKSSIHNHEKWCIIVVGHHSFHVIKLLFPSLFTNLNLNIENLHYEVCELAKHKRVSFPPTYNKISFNLFNWFILMCRVPLIFQIFYELNGLLLWWLYKGNIVFFLKNKSDVSSVMQFVSLIKNQFRVVIKKFKSDNAKDYFNHTLDFFF